eukprot:scaffold2364_cov335-Pinguiococcus_pyrenoidosus.AAC.7
MRPLQGVRMCGPCSEIRSNPNRRHVIGSEIGSHPRRRHVIGWSLITKTRDAHGQLKEPMAGNRRLQREIGLLPDMTSAQREIRTETCAGLQAFFRNLIEVDEEDELQKCVDAVVSLFEGEAINDPTFANLKKLWKSKAIERDDIGSSFHFLKKPQRKRIISLLSTEEINATKEEVDIARDLSALAYWKYRAEEHGPE